MKKTTFSVVIGAVTGVFMTAVLIANADQGDPDLKVNGSPVLTVATSGGPPPTAGIFAGTVLTDGDFGGQAGADGLCNTNFPDSAAVLEPVRVANAAHPLDDSGMFAVIEAGGTTAIFVWVSEDVFTYPFTQLNTTIHVTPSCLDFTTNAANERSTVIKLTPNTFHNSRLTIETSFKSCSDATAVVACFIADDE